jgi:hypothetical protein
VYCNCSHLYIHRVIGNALVIASIYIYIYICVCVCVCVCVPVVTYFALGIYFCITVVFLVIFKT